MGPYRQTLGVDSGSLTKQADDRHSKSVIPLSVRPVQFLERIAQSSAIRFAAGRKAGTSDQGTRLQSERLGSRLGVSP